MQHRQASTAEDAKRSLTAHFNAVRARSEEACAPLDIEDYSLQAMPETSPPKWHLAHTTWFFETFLLAPCVPGYTPFNPAFRYLFNSYYNGIGAQFSRAQRGLLSRPTLAEVLAWRETVNQGVRGLLARGLDEDMQRRLLTGLHHEQQHQELFFTDIQYSLSCNPLKPAYRTHPGAWLSGDDIPPLQWHALPEGLYALGATGAEDFAFDNETPRHRAFLPAFELASRPVTNGEWLAFMADGGYDDPALWLSDGWTARQQQGWQAPLYWQHDEHTGWQSFTLYGMQPIDPARPVCHVSAYEADAFARWAGARLPTEYEWEAAAQHLGARVDDGHFADDGHYHPRPVRATQLLGSVWEWTASSYGPYPGYQPPAGALGEYNGKFMCNQLVLRGGSCVSAAAHIRTSYRNFFYPPDRWQFSGLRLARGKQP
ncbi:hypothetical protein A167_03183 [Alcanivorax sp. S71-1-4]|jgi:ergothioneine biosynthesis protein EgtB|uniref:ergothioneine biosynthesis protein EgtB n=1 Tax=Alcanivorax sp. S71-1-4 TaxID=1177159 RepID=UPI0013568344|nr:ergothioneine biosynthesis protein EgtB [Alcanivorax sp. S71-1-4]KAF0806424.1 hypothetical protein A167_03183 [Alcanivorax sp. S71-1-4]